MKDNLFSASELIEKMNEADVSNEKSGKTSGKRKTGRAARRKAYKKNKRKKDEQAKLLSLGERTRKREAEGKHTSKKPMPPHVERAAKISKEVSKHHYN